MSRQPPSRALSRASPRSEQPGAAAACRGSPGRPAARASMIQAASGSSDLRCLSPQPIRGRDKTQTGSESRG